MELKPTGISPAIDPTARPSRTSADRRRRPRTFVKVAGYMLPENPLTDGAKAEPWEVRVTDFSRFGVAFISGESLQPGEFRRVRVGNGPANLARRVKIVHCQPNGPALFRIGVEFT